jgi:hypothetical protein
MLVALASAVAYLAFGILAIPLASAVAIVLAGALTAGIGPTLDAIAVLAPAAPGRNRFAGLRTWLSFAFALAALAGGVIYGTAGYASAPFVTGGLLVVLALIAGALPDPPREPAALTGARRRGGSSAEAFRVQPKLPLALLTVGLGAVAMTAVFTFLPLRIDELGGSATDVALAAGVESLAEVPAFLLAGAVAARIGIRTLFALSAALIGGCTLALATLADPALMVGIRLLTGVAYAGLTVGMVLSFAALLPPSLQATGQGLWLVTASVVSLLVGVLGGALYEAAGASGLFLVTGAVSLVAALLAFRALPARTREGTHGPASGDPPLSSS